MKTKIENRNELIGLEEINQVENGEVNGGFLPFEKPNIFHEEKPLPFIFRKEDIICY
jgi:hypothetical protein